MKQLSILLFFLAVSFSVFAQKIVTNENDEFTQQHIVRTSWEQLKPTGINNTTNLIFRTSKIDNSLWLTIKMVVNNSGFSVEEGADLMLKFSNGNVVTLKNSEFKTTCTGCGSTGLAYAVAQGIELDFQITDELINSIGESTLSKLRLYTSKGYINVAIQQKNAQKMSKSITMILPITVAR